MVHRNIFILIHFSSLIASPVLAQVSQYISIGTGPPSLQRCYTSTGQCFTFSDLDAESVPSGLVRGIDGWFYFTDSAQHGVWRVDKSGQHIHLFVAPQAGGLAQPSDLAFGPDNHLYVASAGSDAILRFDGFSGDWIDAFIPNGAPDLIQPQGLAFANDQLFVINGVSPFLLVFDAASGQFRQSLDDADGLTQPTDLTYGPDEMLYVSDRKLAELWRFEPHSLRLWDRIPLSNPASSIAFDADHQLVWTVQNAQRFEVIETGTAFALPHSPTSAIDVTPPATPAQKRLVFPWVSNNAQFNSILVIQNLADEAIAVDLIARRSEGPATFATEVIPAHGFLRETAAALFPGLGEGRGYCVEVLSSTQRFSGVWVTNNLEAASGQSPAQGVGIKVPEDPATASNRTGQHVTFGYLPVTQGLTSAPVVVNLGESPADVTLSFYDRFGELVLRDTETLRELAPLRPFAAVVNQLVNPSHGDVYVTASSDGNLITGVSFVFNQGSEPAIGNVTAFEPSTTENQNVQWLLTEGVRLRSADPADEDFSDLEPLRSKIGDARLVMLGEQTHGDGTTFLMKTRLIKFLHQEMGFEVLAFESGLYDCRKAWEQIQNGEQPALAFARGVFPIWSWSQQLTPLSDYLAAQAQAASPLELVGFDLQFTASASQGFLQDLDTYLVAIGSQVRIEDDWDTFSQVVLGLSENAYFNAPGPSSSELAGFSSILTQIGVDIAELGQSHGDTPFWSQVMLSLRIQANRVWALYIEGAPPASRQVSDLRDITMGHNLVALVEKIHAGKKVIAWAASRHTATQLAAQFVGPVDGNLVFESDLIAMGDIVKAALGNQCYSIGFTARDGMGGTVFGSPFEIALPAPGDLEELIHRIGAETLFLDYRQPAPGGLWLSDAIVSRPLGYARIQADWSQVFDAMIYTRTMVPSDLNPVFAKTKPGRAFADKAHCDLQPLSAAINPNLNN